ncbi:MAG TPA: SMC-Scp complex subunit ScpB [Thermoanaerobaculia bacterium]|nr:SMC-Scp complex subunit ScpB [Thermoanaerobaculia bacterium]
MTDRGEMEAAIEAILFVSSEPVPRTRLIELFDEDEREQAAAALAAVLERYAGGEARGVMIEDVAGGVRLVTRPEMGVWLRRFFDVSSGSKLSMAALETLAIVAYRQPITGPEIQELRSVNPVGVLKTLLEKRLVRISGRKEVVGKPFLYATTREFLVHFGLNSLRDLPPLEEFEETFGAGLAAAPAAAAAGSSPMASASLATPAIDPEAGDGRLLEEEDDDAEERFLREAAELDERGEPADPEDREGGEAAGEAEELAPAQPAADWEPPEDDQDAVGEEETAAAATEVER